MTRAEERALEAYPTQDMYSSLLDGSNRLKREVFINGYEQAEKDLALTWEDIKKISRILDIMVDDDLKGEIPKEWGEEEYYEEVLRRFNKVNEEK
jgi:hypothetical protein